MGNPHPFACGGLWWSGHQRGDMAGVVCAVPARWACSRPWGLRPSVPVSGEDDARWPYPRRKGSGDHRHTPTGVCPSPPSFAPDRAGDVPRIAVDTRRPGRSDASPRWRTGSFCRARWKWPSLRSQRAARHPHRTARRRATLRGPAASCRVRHPQHSPGVGPCRQRCLHLVCPPRHDARPTAADPGRGRHRGAAARGCRACGARRTWRRSACGVIGVSRQSHSTASGSSSPGPKSVLPAGNIPVLPSTDARQ